MEAAPKLLAWCGELLEGRRAAGRREDLAGVVAHMGFGEGGLELDEKQRIETINLAVMAGMETTMGGLGAAAWLLATRPELTARAAGRTGSRSWRPRGRTRQLAVRSAAV